MSISGIPLHHLRFEHVKGLSTDELTLLRVEAIDSLTSIDIAIDIIRGKEGDWHKQASVKAHLRRTIGTFNGIIASRNRAKDKHKEKLKEQLKNQHSTIVDLQSELEALKQLIKQANKG